MRKSETASAVFFSSTKASLKVTFFRLKVKIFGRTQVQGFQS